MCIAQRHRGLVLVSIIPRNNPKSLYTLIQKSIVIICVISDFEQLCRPHHGSCQWLCKKKAAQHRKNTICIQIHKLHLQFLMKKLSSCEQTIKFVTKHTPYKHLMISWSKTPASGYSWGIRWSYFYSRYYVHPVLFITLGNPFWF